MWTRENRAATTAAAYAMRPTCSTASGRRSSPCFHRQAGRQQAHRQPPRGGQRADVYPRHRLSVARDPEGFAPRSTIYDYFDRWNWDGTLERIHHALYVKCREQASREASPTAAIIDAQSVKSAEKGGANVDPHGYDAGKKIKGKKRHVLVDTEGLVLHAIVVTAAEDRSAAGYHADCEIRSSPGRRFHRGRSRFSIAATSEPRLA